MKRARKQLIIAHRGEKQLAPENTITAGRLAIEQGATGLEVDIRLCASGELVLFHDKTLHRLFNNWKPVFYSSLAELRKLSFNKAYVKNDRIPTLEEFLEEFRGTVPIILDAKTFGSSERTFMEHLLRTVDNFNMTEQICISAFNPLFLRHLKKQRPDIFVGFLFRNLASIIRNFDLFIHADAWHPHHSLITKNFIKLARRKHKELYVWTVNDPAMVDSFKPYSIEGFISDKLFRKKQIPGLPIP